MSNLKGKNKESNKIKEKIELGIVEYRSSPAKVFFTCLFSFILVFLFLMLGILEHNTRDIIIFSILSVFSFIILVIIYLRIKATGHSILEVRQISNAEKTKEEDSNDIGKID